jgi:hypothetical protein
LTEIWYEKIIMKRSLNSDGHQFHQHQQNEQSPLIITHGTQKIPPHMTLETQA